MTHGPFGLTDEQIAANFERIRQEKPIDLYEVMMQRISDLELALMAAEGRILALEYRLHHDRKPVQ